MTTEALLRPRVIVTIDYPDSIYKKGDVLTQWDGDGYSKNREDAKTTDPEFFPDCFRPLAWWEKRTIDEIYSIKYIKVITYVGYHLVGDVLKVTEYKMSGMMRTTFDSFMVNSHKYTPDTVLPSTEQEYLQQQNKKG